MPEIFLLNNRRLSSDGYGDGGNVNSLSRRRADRLLAGSVMPGNQPPCGAEPMASAVSRILFEDALYCVVGYHLLLESVGAGFGRFHHLDNLRVGTAFAFLQRCNGFLCHIW